MRLQEQLEKLCFRFVESKAASGYLSYFAEYHTEATSLDFMVTVYFGLNMQEGVMYNGSGIKNEK